MTKTINENTINLMDFLRSRLTIPRDWKNEDVIISYSKNMLIHPYDKRNYIIEHKESGEKVYTGLTLDELKSIEDKKTVLYWKNVFNADLKLFHDIFMCFEIIKESGYKYFVFNGKVYKILKDRSFVEINYSIDKIL